MKYVLIVLAMFLVVGEAAAGQYCDTVQNSEVCYSGLSDRYAQKMKHYYKALLNSPKVASDEKQSIVKNQKKWEAMVEAKCNSNRCIAFALETRMTQMAEYYMKVDKR